MLYLIRWFQCDAVLQNGHDKQEEDDFQGDSTFRAVD